MSQKLFFLTINIRPSIIQNLDIQSNELEDVVRVSIRQSNLHLDTGNLRKVNNMIKIDGRHNSELIINSTGEVSYKTTHLTEIFVSSRYQASVNRNDGSHIAQPENEPKQLISCRFLELMINQVFDLVKNIAELSSYAGMNFTVEFKLNNIENCYLGYREGTVLFPYDTSAWNSMEYSDSIQIINGNFTESANGILLLLEERFEIL